MPLSLSMPDPYSTTTATAAWAYNAVFAFNFANKTGRLVYDIHRSKTAAYANKPPIAKVEYQITPTGSPAVYGPAPLVSPYVPAVTHVETVRAPGTDGPDDPGEYQTVVDSPAVDPVYGPAPLLRAAIPSFDELIAVNADAYGQLLAAVDALALTQPEFAKAAKAE